eukprot:gene7862-3343_t
MRSSKEGCNTNKDVEGVADQLLHVWRRRGWRRAEAEAPRDVVAAQLR